MITRQEFPYLQELVINNAYGLENLRVAVFGAGQEYKHLVLTGRNGSGKTSVVNSLSAKIQFDIHNLRSLIEGRKELGRSEEDARQFAPLTATETVFRQMNGEGEPPRTFPNTPGVLFAFFPAYRAAHVPPVTAPATQDAFDAALTKPEGAANFVIQFNQYLVNKKVSQALAHTEGKPFREEEALIFNQLVSAFRKVFSDERLTLVFVSERYEFLINFFDGRRITFNQLSAGFSAFLSILMDLLMRTDLLRKQANDYTYDPCGFVLIDEPEIHLHLEMQYQILPLLTGLFPNLQFIVATHSPAVASSIKNATVFDLSTGQTLGDTAAGSSFSELMQTHFGLENEYSNVARGILVEVTQIGQMPDRAAALARLQHLFAEQGRYMSPVLRLEVQAHLLHLQREQAA